MNNYLRRKFYFRHVTFVLIVFCYMPSHHLRAQEPPTRKHSNVARLQLARLKAVHEDVQLYAQKRKYIPIAEGLKDFRCIMHAHAEDSTHTAGTLPEMLRDAQVAGVHAILLSDHYRPPRDFIDGRWRGLKDGVLFIPGSEARGFLLHPVRSILPRMELQTNELIETVTMDDGLIFLSHIEERQDHRLEGLTGLEIYNRHYDAKRDMGSLLAVAMMLTDPKALEQLQEAVEKYPAELFAFQCDYPEVYLKKWDEGTRSLRLTGIAANDCHHNQVMLVKKVDDQTALLGTNVDQDKDMRKVTAALRPGLKQLLKDKEPGEVAVRVDLDPYLISFRNSCTHILAPKLDEMAIRNALKAGHVYVSHDWMCDATGFQFYAQAGKHHAMMGDLISFEDGITLKTSLPVPAYLRLIRHGVEIARVENSDHWSYPIEEAGTYRLEAWLMLDGEYRPWIYSNPIYIK